MIRPAHTRTPDARAADALVARRFVGKVAFVTGGASGLGRAAVERFAGGQFSLLKNELTEAAVQTLGPIATRMNELMADKAALDTILRDGADKANAIAKPILDEAKRLVGFLPR